VRKCPVKILLINPPIREWAKPNCIPLGLGYVAAVAQKAGHDVEVMDINAFRWSQEEVEEKIKKADFDLAGTGGIVTIYRYIKWLVSILKKYHPGKKVIVGGSVSSSIPDILMERTLTDIACVGEGEVTTQELLSAIERDADLSEVAGIWFKDKTYVIHATKARGSINELDSLPFPAYDLFPMDIYLKNPVGAPNVNKWSDGSSTNTNTLSVNLSASRGCPYNCIYCYHDFMGSRYRTRSPQYVFDEMKMLYQNYGVKYFHFIDDEFVMNKDFVYGFCKKIRESGLDFTWGCAGRVNLMTEDLIATMAGSGCILIGYGIESGSQKMLDIMKKKVTVEQARQAVKLTQKYLGWADCSFMIGTPGETRDTIKETIDFCKELGLTPEVVFYATPYPGTELYEIAKASNKIGDEEEFINRLGEQGEQIMVNFTDFTDNELKAIKEEMVAELNAWNKTTHNS
jgi:anaerobic magnesium-protoporphyrin IX monomethyl ester cyclase